MSKLPSVTGWEAIRAFEKAGFVVDRIRGSHHILKKGITPIRSVDPCTRQEAPVQRSPSIANKGGGYE